MNCDNKANKCVVCEVAECMYHTGGHCCTADKIEVCNCKICGDSGNETFCSTYRERS